MNPHYLPVARRAGHRCEYCHAPEVIFNFPFEVEHIVPGSRQGSDDEGNLALACRACNLRKSDLVSTLDETTGSEVRLFNPREDRWDEHFQVDQETAILYGLMAIGRATIAGLQMNHPVQLEARRQWMRLGLFP